MIDLSYFQNSTSSTQIFQNGGTWQTWIKPRNAKMVSFFVIGAGAGGGGGYQAATGNKSGGAGGGTAGYIKLVIQASILPDILYILPGTGGIGGTGGAVPTAGNPATKSYVCLTPDTSSISNIVCTSGNVAATGGGAGSTVLSTVGAAETVGTAANGVFLNLGNFIANVGIIGGVGNTGIAANSTFVSFTVAGGGGGGTGNGSGLTPTAGQRFSAIASTPVNTKGSDGAIFYTPFLNLFGGRGGGGGTTGGNGGNGAPGCGGGGGGAGTTSAGNGGRGGDGLIMITTNF
tara:strand:+ start:7992 stop:8858 length:867 start_codon:yes stop_codon:yes gene_type:complete